MDTQEYLVEWVEAVSPETDTIYRSKRYPDSPRDGTGNPIQEAREDFIFMYSVWSGVPADLFEPVNEWHNIPMEYKVAYLLELLKLADANGIKLLVPGDAPGREDFPLQVRYAPLYEYILTHPGHGFSRHNYGITTYLPDSGIFLGYRHRLDLEYLKQSVPDADRVPVYITESNHFNSDRFIECNLFTDKYLEYMLELDKDYWVVGTNIFTTSGPFGGWFNIVECLDELAEGIVTAYGG